MLGMKKVSLVLAFGAVAAFADNPIIQTYYSPDPAPVVFGDTVCVYTGNDEGGTFFTMHGWRVSCTTDMVNWTDMNTLILEAGDFNGNAKKNGDWASQCIRRNGKYYYYVTVESSSGGGRAVNVAVSDTKEGPFKDALNGKHLAGPNWDYIDPTVFIDDDGQAYLYWGNPALYSAKLNEDMISFDGKIQSTKDGFNGKYTEGPWIHKRNNKYYMIYAAGGIPESIDYSWSDSPMGPWTYKGTIMPSNESGAAFTVHSGVIDFKGHSYFFYHNQRRVPGAGGYSRTSAVEEFTWKEDETFPTIHMTDEGVTKPVKNLDPYTRVEAETKAWVEGINLNKSGGYTIIQNVETEGKRVYLTNMNKDSYTKVRFVDMSDGADNIVVCTKGGSGKIELHVGSAKGDLLSTINVPASDDWTESSFEVTGADGVQDLYFVFKEGNFKFDYWYFESNAQAVPQEPFKGTPFAIPGTIQMEDFDKTGVGRGNKSFQDNDAENHGDSEYRKDDAPSVDLYNKSGDRIVVGYIQKGEWLAYTVDIAEAGDYTMFASVASDGGSSFSMTLDSTVVAETIEVPKAVKAEGDTTQNFDDYAKVRVNVTLPAGKHILRMTATNDWFDIDYVKFVKGKNAEDTIPQSLYGKAQLVNNSVAGIHSAQVFDMNGRYLGNVRVNSSAYDEMLQSLRSAGFTNGSYFVRIPGMKTLKLNAVK